MYIKYASEHKWIEKVTDDPMSELGKNNRARLKSTLKKIDSTSVNHRIELLSEDILNWFTPLYHKTISSKSNAKLFDLHKTTLGKKSPYKYYALILEENNNPIGATIFSCRKNILSVAYRIFPNKWSHNNLQANPSLYGEYILNVSAQNFGYEKISHGKDRNPYGINASIGLAAFKLSVGCSAYLPSTPYEMQTINLREVNEDILLLLPPECGTKIEKAVLYAHSESIESYKHLQKYSDRLKIEEIVRA